VRFVLDGGPGNGGAQLDDHAAPFQVTFSNVGKAEHTIDAYIIDASGNLVSGAATHDSVAQIGIGDYYVTMGDSITAGYGDNSAADNTSNDGRNSGGGYEPVLNNLLTAAKRYPQNVVNEGVGGTTSSDGAALVSSLLTRHPNASMFLVDYGMNDARPWLPVPSGLGKNPGDSGYAGSFKDKMQQIINAVNGAGKKIAISKINPALGDCAETNPSAPEYCGPPYPNFSTGARTVLIQQYNQVIDELRAISSNKITVVPPDLYTYFANHYQTEYFDNIHPNGVGYQSIGNLWLQALP
jgi:lysophospholipase L1-like esterase